jgi:hemolysin D
MPTTVIPQAPAPLDSIVDVTVDVPPSIAAPEENGWSSVTQELLDSLPKVWARGLLYFLLIFAGIVIPWSMLSNVDETGSARGRLEPKGKTLKLDAPVAGTIAAVRVKEGQAVKAGQVLFEMESQLVESQLQQEQAKLEGLLNRVQQLKLIESQLEIAIRSHQQQGQAQKVTQLTQIEQTRQQLLSSQESYRLAQERLARDHIEVQRYQSLQAAGAIPQVKVVEVERAADENKRLLGQADAEIKHAQYEIKKQQSDYDAVAHTGEIAVLDSGRQVEETQAQRGELETAIIQAQKQISLLQYQRSQLLVRSPIAGTIFQLAVTNAGTVVQVGQPVSQIAPKAAQLTFRAQMLSQDSGFLRLGMPVKLKFDAYPFQDYGIVLGKVRWISPDSKPLDTAQGKVLAYDLEVELASQSQREHSIKLTPGQTATAEVIVRQRRVIDFILDPFKKLQNDGLKL